jgi:hypothetical protein
MFPNATTGPRTFLELANSRESSDSGFQVRIIMAFIVSLKTTAKKSLIS